MTQSYSQCFSITYNKALAFLLMRFLCADFFVSSGRTTLKNSVVMESSWYGTYQLIWNISGRCSSHLDTHHVLWRWRVSQPFPTQINQQWLGFSSNSQLRDTEVRQHGKPAAGVIIGSRLTLADPVCFVCTGPRCATLWAVLLKPWTWRRKMPQRTLHIWTLSASKTEVTKALPLLQDLETDSEAGKDYNHLVHNTSSK